jgi:hypothetical protein
MRRIPKPKANRNARARALAANRQGRSAKGAARRARRPRGHGSQERAPGQESCQGAEKRGPREGTKAAQVVAMLRRKNGATLVEIMETTGWQKHTVGGFMAGAMKKAGYEVESFKPEGAERSYRIERLLHLVGSKSICRADNPTTNSQEACWRTGRRILDFSAVMGASRGLLLYPGVNASLA